MTIADDIDKDKLAEAALAILSLTAEKGYGNARAWKGMDWDLLAVLYEKGWIFDPVGKQKSVIFSDEGYELAEQFLAKHFGK